MKKILSVALCAAMILSMASVSYASDVKPTLSNAAQTTTVKSKTIKPVTTVSEPDLPEDIDEQYTYLMENQTPAEFIEILQKFGAKTSSMLLSKETENQTYSPVSFAYALGILGSGAKGTTAQNIAKALESNSMSTVSDGLNKFYNSNYSDEENSVLKIANSLWMQDNYNFKTSFTKNAAEKFYASSYSVDFKKQATADAILSRPADCSIQPLNQTQIRYSPSSTLSILKVHGQTTLKQKTTQPENLPLLTGNRSM